VAQAVFKTVEVVQPTAGSVRLRGRSEQLSTDGGAGGVGTFRLDTNWTPNGTVAARFVATEIPVAPPTAKDDCKNGGWETFNDPLFKNQGDCIKYVEDHG
jgi:hypothetical protein